MSSKPWVTGSKELLTHAIDHMSKKTSFDYRIAFISIDNAVELAIKTYLSLPKRVRGSEGPSKKQLEEAGTSFPTLLDLFEKYAKIKINGIDLGDIDWYHRIRNTLYHEGNGITVEPDKVDSYLQTAQVLFNSLFESSSNEESTISSKILTEETFESPRTLLGKFTLKWAFLDIELRHLAGQYIPNSLLYDFNKRCSALESKGIISNAMKNKLETLYPLRNEVIHGAKLPPPSKIQEMIDTIDLLLGELKK